MNLDISLSNDHVWYIYFLNISHFYDPLYLHATYIIIYICYKEDF